MTHQLTAYPTTDLFDAHEAVARPCRLAWLHFGLKTSFAGRARTVLTFEDTALAKTLYSSPGEGAVAVIDGGGSLRSALLGDLNAALLQKNNWAGVIIHGAIRDSAAINAMDIGVMALGATPVRSSKSGIGHIDVPVLFGGVLIEPGDCIYCDADGVLVSKQALTLN